MAVVLLSGGIDSATALADLLDSRPYTSTLALTFNYGQRHRKELVHAGLIAEHYEVPRHTVDLRSWGLLLKGSALTDPYVAVPHGEYDEATMATTVVPGRNAVMLSIAASIAVSTGHSTVVLGAHAGDHALYPDCRPGFIEQMANALSTGVDRGVYLMAPFLERDKADIVRRAAQLRVPLGLTWSCYEGGRLHCGRCGTCLERRQAFEAADVEDRTGYAA